MKPRWTDETEAQAKEYYKTLSMEDLRKWQDLCFKQLEMAYKQKNERALYDLRRMENAITEAILERV